MMLMMIIIMSNGGVIISAATEAVRGLKVLRSKVAAARVHARIVN